VLPIVESSCTVGYRDNGKNKQKFTRPAHIKKPLLHVPLVLHRKYGNEHDITDTKQGPLPTHFTNMIVLSRCSDLIRELFCVI
jgi:hypothetical protein